MAKFTRTVITTDVTLTMVHTVGEKEEKQTIETPLGTVTLDGEYPPLKGARKARKDEGIKKTIEDIVTNGDIKSYDVTATCAVHENKYSMDMETFLKYATLES